ncbi:MAG: nucleotidyltransferase domain-containing protein [Candidatus Aenigmarchaeota archaeon]|nr:nucleotidyltransferase domain-containing protein [Candidatus Aenigmarchaeota archaeon]
MLQFHKDILAEFKKAGKNTEVILFGSVAKGRYRLDSDIDIAIISDDKKVRERSSKIADKILVKYGKVVSVKFFTKNEFYERMKRKDPFVVEVSQGKVIYSGRKN